MKTQLCWIGMIAFCLGISQCNLLADGDEENLPAEQLPDAVRAAAGVELGFNSSTKQIHTKKLKGTLVFILEAEAESKEICVHIAENGTVLRKESEVAASEVPEAVKSALESRIKGATFEDAHKVVTPEGTAFNIEAEVPDSNEDNGGKFTISATGTILASNEKVELISVPEAVKKVIDHEIGKDVRETRKIFAKGTTVYESQGTWEGKNVELQVSEQGRIIRKETEDPEVETDDDDDEDDDDDKN